MDMVKFCRLCLDIIYDNDFCPMEDCLSQIDQLCMKVNLGISSDPVICNNCATNLQDLFNFKLKCLSTGNIILPFKDIYQKSAMDLESHLKEGRDIDINNISEDKKICRFCMTLDKYEFTRLYDAKENILIVSTLQKRIPELKMHIAEELIACKSCFDSLQNFHGFITKCTEVEEKITKYAESEGVTDINGHIQLNEVTEIKCKVDEVRQSDIYDECAKESNCSYIKTENLLEEDKADMSIKSEEIDLKTEPTDSDSRDTATLPQRDIQMYECHKCSFKTKWKSSLRLHIKNHQSPKITLCKCTICPYETSLKFQLKEHMLRHKDPSELKMFTCQLCTYKTKFQNHLKTHMIAHKDINLMTKIYKCNFCLYAGKVKGHLNKHMLVHKNPSEVRMYKCRDCTFETKHQSCLRRHSFTHKRPEAAFKCDSCSYETIKLSNLKRHMISHRDKFSLETNLLQCYNCSFNTKYKHNLKNHMIVHQNLSGLKKFKCEKCTYESRHRGNLKRHMVNCGVSIGPRKT